MSTYENTKIGTGYFARLKEYVRLDYTPVSICVNPPKWYNGKQFKPLAPKSTTVAEYKCKAIDWSTYCSRYYNETLKWMDAEFVYNTIIQMTPSDRKIVLLCYEKVSFEEDKNGFYLDSKDNCHRHLVSEWLNNHLGSGTVNEICWKQ